MTYRTPGLKRVSLRTRRKHQLQLEHTASQMNFLLLAILAQRGGEVTISSGTMQMVAERVAEFGYSIAPNPAVEGEFIVKLLTGPQGAEEPVPDHKYAVELVNSTTRTLWDDGTETAEEVQGDPDQGGRYDGK